VKEATLFIFPLAPPHFLFSLLGVYIQSEVHTKNGRADAVVYFDNHIYCFEFKLDQSAEVAVQQIKERDYMAKYVHSAQSVHLIGINFSSQEKKVAQLIWEKMK
jgi:hypothetical protein